MKAIANEITRDLIKGVDLGNTVLGGMSQSFINHVDSENEYIIEVKTPGLDADNYSIEIRNNTLFLYSTMSLDPSGESKAPYLMRHFLLPYYVDLDGIFAEYFEGTLRVVLPYKYLKDGFSKHIDIIH